MPFHVALEITPPRLERPAILRRRAALLGDRPDAVHVIQRPDRLSSLEASLLLRSDGWDAVWHCANRGRSREAIRRDAARAREGGIRSVLCIRGEHAAEDRPDTPRIRDVVALLRAGDPGLRVGVTLNQYLERARVLRNLWPKLQAGADFVQTQPVVSLADLAPFAEELRARRPGVRLLAMLIPLASRDEAERIGARLGVPLPEPTLAALEEGGREAGWRLFERTLRALRASPLVDGVALMTPRADPDRETAERVAAALDDLR